MAADILYHYCSAASLVAIATTRSIRLSALSLSNDTMEGRLVNSTVMRLAERDELDARARERLQESLAFLDRYFEGLGFCLSEDSDLLSQWRGYADDARGVAIGFARPNLDSMAASSRREGVSGFVIQKVEYDPQEHEAQVEPTYRELRKLIDAGAFKHRGSISLLDSRTAEQVADDDKRIEEAHRALIFRIVLLFPKLYQLKSSAFREEREWRLVSMLIANTADTCLFRAAGGRVIPYRNFELTSQQPPAIAEVVMGPKHETPPNVIQSMLKQAGFGEVPIRRSAATYR